MQYNLTVTAVSVYTVYSSSNQAHVAVKSVLEGINRSGKSDELAYAIGTPICSSDLHNCSCKVHRCSEV
eukprot:18827-Heterococcus_DN1.PRE.3